MRSRNIKPGYFKNEELAECDPLARILFAGLWCLADREGRMEYRPKRIKAELLPYDDVDVKKLLNQLLKYEFIVIYEADGQQYLTIPKFTDHQNCHIREAESTIPAPDEHSASTVQAPDEHGSSPADSLLPLTDSPILIPSYAPLGAHVVKNQFDRFWKAYPKKKSKGRAERAFLKINPDEQLLATMIATIEQAKTSEEWIKQGGQFIPYPASWLNARGWEDEETEKNPLAGQVSETTRRNMAVMEEWRPPA
jgi:hypothetical protein